MDIGAADTAVANLHLDVGGLELLGGVVTPLHVAVGGRRVVGDPALEVGGRRHYRLFVVVKRGRRKKLKTELM